MIKSTLGYVAALLLALGLFTQAAAQSGHATSHPHGKILWDTYGVPHIFGKTETAVFYGFGYAQAQSHGDLILRLYGEARGRASEYWGPQYLDSDNWVVVNNIYERAAQWYKEQTPQFRADLDAFALGINEYVAQHPDAVDPEVKVVLPITGIDIIAHAQRLTNFSYVASSRRILGTGGVSGGSNAWAIAPSKSASGHTMVLANPHLPWAPGELTYYEAQLEGPNIDMYGATQVGLPVLRFCFNSEHSFTNTVNQVIGDTAYKLTLAPDGYMFDGKVLRFTTEDRVIRVKQPDSSLKDDKITIRKTVQGPVFVKPDGETIALRVAGLDRPGMLQEYWDMGKAHNFEEFQAALKRLQVPTFNIVYGDRQGHIMYIYNGVVPEHPSGDFKYWRGDVPGDTSATLWTKIHPYSDLPKVIDPPSGFVQNTNDPPWIVTWPSTLKPSDFPPYMAPLAGITMRSQRSVELLMSKPKLTYDDFVNFKFSNRSLLADRVLPDLLAAAASNDDPNVRDAVAVLKAWDHEFNPDSKGALLFDRWAARLMGANYANESNFAHPFTLADPLNTPSGLKDPAAAVKMLGDDDAEVKKRFGSLDPPYGGTTRYKVGDVPRVSDVSVPGESGSGSIGIFPSMIFSPFKDGTRDAFSGETWISMVEFTTPLKAEGLMSYGDSTQPGTKHRTDQIELLSERKLRTFWMTRPVIEKHLEETTSY
jgi:acyl-homoserine-lactone acylase